MNINIAYSYPLKESLTNSGLYSGYFKAFYARNSNSFKFKLESFIYPEIQDTSDLIISKYY